MNLTWTDDNRPLVLLDLDGTLLDSGPGIMTSAAAAFKELGLPVPDEPALRGFVGPAISQSMSANGVPPDRLAEAVRAYRTAADRLAIAATRKYEGIDEQLQTLRRAGAALLVATSKPHVYALPICEHFGLMRSLDGVYGAPPDGVTVPKEQIVGQALAHFGWAADRHGRNVLMVGDRHYDVTGAAAHGVPCLGVGWGYAEPGELLGAGAAGVVEDVDGLSAAVCSTWR